MDLLELIKTRRSIRKYTAEQIGREELERIIEAGLYARCFVILGHCMGAFPQPKPRREGRFLITEKSGSSD